MASPGSSDTMSNSSDGSFNPSTQWLDGSTPQHPLFDDHEKIASIISNIKDGVLTFALEACLLILSSEASENDPHHNEILKTLSHNSDLWRAALLAQRYGVVYFMSRSEARDRYFKQVTDYPILTDAIDTFLNDYNSAGIRIMNYAVHAYICRSGIRVDHADSFVPPNAIACIGPSHVVVRYADFFQRSPTEILATSTPIWDLHDLAHLSCATLSPELFGNKYHPHLHRLPKALTALIRSPGMRTATGPKISDGIVFSELLTQLFTDKVDELCLDLTVKQDPQVYADLTSSLAAPIADYYLAQRSLLHPSTNTFIIPSSPITPTQLAVLVQNKAYELPASEIEQRIFTRGGVVAGSSVDHDELARLSWLDRIAWLAETEHWNYFEVRNTVKHRAHKMAYGLVCEVLIARSEGQGKEVELLEKVRANLGYLDWKAEGGREVLWDLV